MVMVTCDICNKSFCNIYVLRDHKKIHLGEAYNCEKCDKSFSNKTTLTRHNKKIHNIETKYPCKVCGETFTRIPDLAEHKKTHKGEKIYACNFCHKGFSQSGQLIVHKRIHTGEKPYVCDQCQKAFSDSSSLRRHKRSHTGERLYTCDVCDSKFTECSSLAIHKRKHTGVPLFTCEICQKTFYQGVHYRNHMRVHTGEKPYSCFECLRPYTSSAALSNHAKRSGHKIRDDSVKNAYEFGFLENVVMPNGPDPNQEIDNETMSSNYPPAMEDQPSIKEEPSVILTEGSNIKFPFIENNEGMLENNYIKTEVVMDYDFPSIENIKEEKGDDEMTESFTITPDIAYPFYENDKQDNDIPNAENIIVKPSLDHLYGNVKVEKGDDEMTESLTITPDIEFPSITNVKQENDIPSAENSSFDHLSFGNGKVEKDDEMTETFTITPDIGFPFIANDEQENDIPSAENNVVRPNLNQLSFGNGKEENDVENTENDSVSPDVHHPYMENIIITEQNNLEKYESEKIVTAGEIDIKEETDI